MTESEYNQAEGIRRSDLWRMHESPEKFKWFLEHPPEPTPALIFGTAVHKLLLEPDEFNDEFAGAPNVDRRTKAGKEEWERFLSESSGKTAISFDDLDTASGMVAKAMTVPFVRTMLDHGKTEQAFFWVDDDTELLCKVRIDILSEIEGKVVITDYKTTANAKTDIFNQSIFRHGYHLQAYMYSEAVMKNLKLSYRPDFYFLAQEKQRPYSVNLIQVSEDVMMAGMDCFRELIGTLALCKKNGYFYGYNGIYNEPNETYLPGWMSLGEEET